MNLYEGFTNSLQGPFGVSAWKYVFFMTGSLFGNFYTTLFTHLYWSHRQSSMEKISMYALPVLYVGWLRSLILWSDVHWMILWTAMLQPTFVDGVLIAVNVDLSCFGPTWWQIGQLVFRGCFESFKFGTPEIRTASPYLGIFTRVSK